MCKQGCKTVPVEPTREMLDAGHCDLTLEHGIDAMLKYAWSQMLDAAPSCECRAEPVASVSRKRDVSFAAPSEDVRKALKEAIALRVSLWRNGDFEGDGDKLSDDEVARKDPYARKWLAAIAAEEAKKAAPAESDDDPCPECFCRGCNGECMGE